MIFATNNPEVVAYLRACRMRNIAATIGIESVEGKETITGLVLGISEIGEPEPHWEIGIALDRIPIFVGMKHLVATDEPDGPLVPFAVGGGTLDTRDATDERFGDVDGGNGEHARHYY